MSQDWTALGRAIADRLEDEGMTMTDLANKSNVSLTTVRELVHVLNTRKRNPRTLAALSEALNWPSDHRTKVLRGSAGTTDAPRSEIDALRQELQELRDRVTALEQAQS
jgi:hypothetical protein